MDLFLFCSEFIAGVSVEMRSTTAELETNSSIFGLDVIASDDFSISDPIFGTMIGASVCNKISNSLINLKN